MPAEVGSDGKEGKKFEITGWMAGLNMAFSIAFFIFMYKYLPLLATTELKRVNPVFGKISGCPTSFCTSLTGTYGSVEWVSVYSSIEQLQRGQETISTNAEFAHMVDKDLSKVYLPGALQLAWRKIA